MTEAQKCLYHIAENMRMYKSISKEGYEYFQQAIKALEQEPKTEQEIRKELYNLSTYRLPNSNTDLVSLRAVERVLNFVFRGCRDLEPKTEEEQ